MPMGIPITCRKTEFPNVDVVDKKVCRDTQWLFDSDPVSRKEYRDFHRHVLSFFLQFSNVFHDSQWLFDSHPVSHKRFPEEGFDIFVT